MNHSSKTAFLLLGDITILYISLFAMLIVRYGNIATAPLFEEHLVPFSILFVLWVAVFFIHNLYDLTAAKNSLEFFTALGRAVLVNLIIAVTLFYFVPFFDITPKRNLFITLGFFVILFSFWRQGINRLLRKHFQRQTMLIGPLKDIGRIIKVFGHNPQIGYRVVLAFAEQKPQHGTPVVVRTPDEFSRIAELARQYKIETVVVSEEAYQNSSVVAELESLLGHNIEIVSLENMEERLERRVRLERINELWFFEHFAHDRKITYGTVKRLVDICIALLILPIATVLGFVIAAVMRLEDRGPIFYTQTRVGEYGRPFRMIKFRTMRSDAEKDGAQWTVENDPRVTRVGRFLRKTRLDELPQIINVLRGDMSFVGPRAERPEFHDLLKKEIPFYERRYLIKPGLTGWAQINYTYGSSIDDTRQKLAYDLYYLKNRSIIFDSGVILKTIDLVLRGLGR